MTNLRKRTYSRERMYHVTVVGISPNAALRCILWGGNPYRKEIMYLFPSREGSPFGHADKTYPLLPVHDESTTRSPQIPEVANKRARVGRGRIWLPGC